MILDTGTGKVMSDKPITEEEIEEELKEEEVDPATPDEEAIDEVVESFKKPVKYLAPRPPSGYGNG